MTDNVKDIVERMNEAEERQRARNTMQSERI